MKFLKNVKNLIRSCDNFGTIEFFRYKSQQSYVSFFGGLLSVLVAIGIVVIFFYRGWQCLERRNIYSSSAQKNQVNPPLLNVSTWPLGDFMAAIEVPGLDLVDPEVEYFDVRLYQYEFERDEETWFVKEMKTKEIELQSCSYDHWEGFPEIQEQLGNLRMDKLLCFPMNTTLETKGKFTSFYEKYFYLQMTFSSCNQSMNDSSEAGLPRCATSQEYNEVFKNPLRSRLQIYFINHHITPDKLQDVNYFLEDRYYAAFSSTLGSESIVYLQDYTINTDQSIFPWQSILTKTGGLVDQLQRISQFYYGSNNLVTRIFFKRSYFSKFYQRKFQKFENVFSLIGGVFGFLCSMLNFMKSYNDESYEVSLASNLFNPKNQSQQKFFEDYNFLTYLQYCLFDLLKSSGVSLDSASLNEFHISKKQTTKQFDVVYLIERILYLQNAVFIILDQDEVKQLKMREKPSLTYIKNIREGVDLKEEFEKCVKLKGLSKSGFETKKNKWDENEVGCLKNNVGLKEKQGVEYEKKGMVQLFEYTKLNEKSINEGEVIEDNLESKKEGKGADEYFVGEQNKDGYLKERYSKERQILKGIAKIIEEARTGVGVSKKLVNSSLINSPVLEGRLPELIKVKKTKRSIISPVSFNKQQSETNPIEGQCTKKNLDKNAKSQPKWESQEESHWESKCKQKSELKFKSQNGQNQKCKQENQQKLETNSLNYQQDLRRLCLKGMKSVRKFIIRSDLFSVIQFFRYAQRSTYRTVMGGLISILIILGMGILFYDKLIECAQKQKIFAQEGKFFSSNPSELVISTVPKGNFMAAVYGQGFDFNDERYVDFQFQLLNRIRQYNQSTGEVKEQDVYYQLQKCTQDHFAPFPQIYAALQLINVQFYLCLPLNMTFSLQGRQHSNSFKSLELIIKLCKVETDSNRSCVVEFTQGFIDSYNPPFTLFVCNSIVNPDTHDYINYYTYDLATFNSRKDLTTEVSLMIESYTIKTDQSIFPWTDQLVETGVMLTDNPKFISFPENPQSRQIGRFKLLRSSKSKLYTRTFEKLADVFAFIGGIYGIVSAVLFIFSSYNIAAYQFDIASKLFHPLPNDKKLLKQYNLIIFILQSIHSLFQNIGLNLNWNLITEYNRYQTEITQQLDVVYIFKRLQFLETAISMILENFQITGIHLIDKMTLDQAKQSRKKFKLKQEIRKANNRMSLFANKQIFDKNSSFQNPIKSHDDKPVHLGVLKSTNKCSQMHEDSVSGIKSLASVIELGQASESSSSSDGEEDKEREKKEEEEVIQKSMRRMNQYTIYSMSQEKAG